jgi:hypothetical protein
MNPRVSLNKCYFVLTLVSFVSSCSLRNSQDVSKKTLLAIMYSDTSNFFKVLEVDVANGSSVAYNYNHYIKNNQECELYAVSLDTVTENLNLRLTKFLVNGVQANELNEVFQARIDSLNFLRNTNSEKVRIIEEENLAYVDPVLNTFVVNRFFSKYRDRSASSFTNQSSVIMSCDDYDSKVSPLIEKWRWQYNLNDVDFLLDGHFKITWQDSAFVLHELGYSGFVEKSYTMKIKRSYYNTIKINNNNLYLNFCDGRTICIPAGVKNILSVW